MGKIVAIIMTMIGIVIGANLIAPVNTATSLVLIATPISGAVSSLTALLPLLFVVVVMIFAVQSVGD